MSEKAQNIYISALSSIIFNEKKAGSLLCMYKEKITNTPKKIPGIFSGEPALRYYIRKKMEEGILPDKFVFLCTQKVVANIPIVERNMLRVPDIFAPECDSEAAIEALEDIKKKIEPTFSKEEIREERLEESVSVIWKTLQCINVIKNQKIEECDKNHGREIADFSTYDYVRAIIYYELYEGGVINDERFPEINDESSLKDYVIKKTEITVKKENEEKEFLFSESVNGEEVLVFIEDAMADFENSEELRVCIDLTGGSRLTSLTALLAAQCFESNWTTAKLCNIYYSAVMEIKDENKAFYLIDWLDSYRKFNIKEFNVRGLNDSLDAKTDKWLHDFVGDTKTYYKFKEGSGKINALNIARQRIEHYREKLEGERPGLIKMHYLNLCYKALTKIDIIEHGTVRNYVEERMKKPYVFISYSHRDSDKVYNDVKLFIKHGINIVYDIILELYLGVDWDKVVKGYLTDENCKGVLFYTSEASLTSPSVFEEIKTVREYKKNSIQVSLWDISKQAPEQLIDKLCAENQLDNVKKAYEGVDIVQILHQQFDKGTARNYIEGQKINSVLNDDDEEKMYFIDQVSGLLNGEIKV